MITETDLDNARIGECENCHEINIWVRPVEVKTGFFGSGHRGFYTICFGCVGPLRFWDGPRGKMETPLSWVKERVQKYLQKKVAE